tara:strand:- start:1002 stop:3944 length:2943 start_codon:yes stop_codon:yes gene_type:complete
MQINYKSIEAFEKLSDDSIQYLEKVSEIYKVPLGYPIIQGNFIPNKIIIILSGEARIIHSSMLGRESICKIKTNSFIGLASLLCANGCEPTTASNDLIALSIPDKDILDLYFNELSFKKWCDSKLFEAEIYEISKVLYEQSSKAGDLSVNKITKELIKDGIIEVIENKQRIQIDEEFEYILSSSNLYGKNIGDKLTHSNELNSKNKTPIRILKISKTIFAEIFELNNNFDKESISSSETYDELRKQQYDDFRIDQSSEITGTYFKKEFKLIKSKGILNESVACLQMIAKQLDLPFRSDSIEKILRDSLKRGRNPSIQLIGGITTMMGLHSSVAKVSVSAGTRLPNNSIVTWKDSFAVVKDSSSKFLEIASPSEGILVIKEDELEKNFKDGFIDLLVVEKNEQTPENKFGLKWLLPSINRYKSILLQVLLASFIVQLLGLINPLMIQVIIDKVINQRSLDTLQILGFALVIATVLGGVISSLRTFLFNETTNRIDTRLGSEVIDHLLRLPLGYFDKRPVGELGSRIAELEKIRNFLTGQALTTILDAIFSLIYIVVMVIYSWLLTLIALSVVPLQILITLLGTPIIRRQIREVAFENAKTQSHLVEVLTGIQTVKAQNVERVSRWKWQDLYSKYISRSFQKTITGTALNETSKVLQQLSQLLVLWIGATLVLKGELTLGQLIAFRIISGYVTQPLLRLSTIWQNIQELRVSFERLADIVDTPEEANEADKSKIPLPSINGAIEFSDISFSFIKGQPEILKNVDLKIEKGQFIGIVGQSGSGKSTLVKLLPRLYKPTRGRLIIDGYDIDKVELYSLRRQIGIVPQDPLLFAGNINDNIALTDPEASSEEIVKAAKIANAHDFIMELSDGYSSKVGERGAGLSGGQRQRIAIARTLLSNPKLLILDEATSALDYDTEKIVCEGLRRSCKGSTVLFITHRLSTVKNADSIVMLHQGAIVEKGTHQELMNMQGRYYALYSQQESS